MPAAAAVGSAGVVYVASAARVVKQYERGVVFRLGRLAGEVREPGFTLVVPVVDRLHKVNMQIVTLPVEYDASRRAKEQLLRLRLVQLFAAVRFDGKAAHLSVTNVNRSLKSFTLFLVASPRANAGGFRGLIAANATGKNDYTTGFTCDLSWPASTRLDHVNVEGAGFGLTGQVRPVPGAEQLPGPRVRRARAPCRRRG